MSADDDFLDQLASPRFCERLFAHLPDVVFCLKDRERRYRAANQAFAERLGLDHPRKLLGRVADEFFPEHLAAAYREQDLQVLESGREVSDRLELVTNRNGTLGWYLHLEKDGSLVQLGDRIAQGQPIARSGHVGRSLAPHLHFQVTDTARTSTLPVAFADVDWHRGVPRMIFFYTSGNTAPPRTP